MDRREFVVGSAAGLALVAGCLERAEEARRAVEDDGTDGTPSDERESPTDGDDETTGQGTLSVAGLQADADSDDADMNDEYITYENTGDAPLDLTGWTVQDADGTTYTFPDGFALDPGETVTLYTGEGTDTESELYWGRANEVWDNGADTMTVRDDRGGIVLQRSYP